MTWDDFSIMCKVVVSMATFVGVWIYCIAEYGFLLGVGLGWLPAMIITQVLMAILADRR